MSLKAGDVLYFWHCQTTDPMKRPKPTMCLSDVLTVSDSKLHYIHCTHITQTGVNSSFIGRTTSFVCVFQNPFKINVLFSLLICFMMWWMLWFRERWEVWVEINTYISGNIVFWVKWHDVVVTTMTLWLRLGDGRGLPNQGQTFFDPSDHHDHLPLRTLSLTNYITRQVLSLERKH